MSETIDPIELSRALIRCPSVTPEDAGALDVLQEALDGLGFSCHRLPFADDGAPTVDNLYARLGDGGPNFCFAGHTDVVPVGQADAWSVDPFGGDIHDDRLWGRGAADMKGAIGAFVAAVSSLLADGANKGSISLLITGDEEGRAINGTVKVLGWMAEHGETIDACLVGEPTNPTRLGEMVKIGRRGSLNGRLTVLGTQGHAAYPERADNPIPRLIAMLESITARPLDEGTEHFPPSAAQITTIDVGNPTANLIPARASAGFNIRFNDRHTGDGLSRWIGEQCAAIGGPHDLEITVSGEAFLTPPGPLSDIVLAAIKHVTGLDAELGTTGGTSDARFIKDHCPVAEFGLTNETAHKADENSTVSDIRALADIYRAVLDGFFAA